MWRRGHNRQEAGGQSLIEAVAAVAVIMIVLTGLISALVYSMANTRFARSKAESNRYAEEAIEWLRVQRDSADSWIYFYDFSAPKPGCRYYCPTEPLSGLNMGGLINYQQSDLNACLDAVNKINDTNYIRVIGLCSDGVSNDKVEATVGVYWRTGRCQSGSFCYHSTIVTEYTNWQ